MRVVIAGGHGQIALRLGRLLAARGDRPVGLVRNPAHAPDLLGAGVEPVVCDLETATVDEVAGYLAGADAVVFAAGAGPGSGAGRKDSVDRGGAVLLADAAVAAGVRRYVLVSTRGAGAPPRAGADEIWGAYVAAKSAADAYVAGLALDFTILRPAALTNEPGTGRVQLTDGPVPGDVTRDDVAAVLVALLDAPASAGRTLELTGGDTPVTEAVASVGQQHP